MNLGPKDMITKKLLDAQEMVRDYEMFSKHTEDKELQKVFKNFAEESGQQAQALQRMADQYRRD